MVDFRYHLVSIVAVFVALAVGIVLGAGPLKNASDQQLRDQVQAVRVDNDGLREQLSASRASVGAANQFSAQIAAGLVARRLPRTPVVVVVLPGGDNAVTDAVSDLLVAAGATVTGTVSIRSTWIGADADTRFSQALRAVSPSPTASSSSLPSPSGPSSSPSPSGPPSSSSPSGPTVSPEPTGSPSGASPGATTSADLSGGVARLLAGAVVGPPPVSSGVPGTDPTGTATTSATGTPPPPSPGPLAGSASAPGSGVVDGPALQALAGAGLIETAGDLTARASSVVVVAAAAPAGDLTDETRAGVDRLTALTRALRLAGSGEVVAGPAGAARDGGVVSDVRSDPDAAAEVSTVDSADDPAGAVAVVLALLEQVQGGVGAYGSIGTTDGAVPEITGVSGQ